ncbi:MAG: hypothetical protein IIZ35_03630 [Clostridia bacterium]|nr:hypothetical protein [Clostridia bacterium]
MKDVAFPIYYNWYERIKEYLPLEERFEVFDALKEYYENGTDPIRAVRESLRFPVSLMYDQIVFSREKSEKASQAGKIGASVTNGKKKKKKEETEREERIRMTAATRSRKEKETFMTKTASLRTG